MTHQCVQLCQGYLWKISRFLGVSQHCCQRTPCAHLWKPTVFDTLVIKQGGFITSLLTSHIKPSSCSTEELCPISWKKRETCSWKLNFDIESFLKHLFSCYILELMNINLISMWGQTPNNELSINEVSIPATFRTRYSQGHALGLWVRNGCLVKPSELQ